MEEEYQEGYWPERVWQLFTGALLLAGGFLAGFWWQNGATANMARIEIASAPAVAPALVEGGAEVVPLVTGSSAQNIDFPTDCVFVASAKGKKYHSVKSGPAKQIKLENRRCFVSEDAAKQAGFVAGML